MRNDFFRPFGAHALRAGLDAEGRLVAWQHRVLATPRPRRSAGLQDAPEWMGTVDPDGIPAALVGAYSAEFSALDAALPMGWWRAPVHTFVAFPIQCFLDEVAQAAGADPLDFRRRLLGEAKTYPYEGHGGPLFDSGRLRHVLDRAAAAIGWGRAVAAGHGLGIACHFTFGGYTAHAMEVSVKGDRLRIERCVAAVDIGRVINPLGVDAQIMGGTLDGLSAAWGQQITVEDGRIQQSNFHDYPLLRMAEAPDVEVIQVASEAEPAGAGEMGIPSAAPAFLNALFAASGRRIRQLPLLSQWRA
jgi:isoquinoline 1-oxidoreductase beta subunit